MGYYRKIVGERLYLSPFDADNTNFCAKWAEWMNDKTVADNFGEHHNLVSLASAKKTIEGFEGRRFAMILLDGDILIGQISLHNIDHLNRNAFLGIVIGEKEHRNKGYGTEAVRLALDYGFKTLNLNNIMLSVYADNDAGIACYKKVGFQESGRRREWVFKDGRYIDKIYMDILAREFEGMGM